MNETEIEALLPWPQPKGCYDSDGPRGEAQSRPFTISGVTMLVRLAPAETQNASRDRYEVRCETCNVVVHSATTGATIRVIEHLRDVHDIID